MLQILLQFVVAVRAADDHQRWTSITHLNLFTNPALLFPRFAFCSAVHHFQHGCVNHAHHRFAFFNQGNIDRELAVALDELFCTIERIDQPEALPVLAHVPALRVFF
ncbi:hypothetical protein D3C72_2258370 [compost metagenome]